MDIDTFCVDLEELHWYDVGDLCVGELPEFLVSDLAWCWVWVCSLGGRKSDITIGLQLFDTHLSASASLPLRFSIAFSLFFMLNLII